MNPKIAKYIKIETNKENFQLFTEDGELIFDSAEKFPSVRLRVTPEQTELLDLVQTHNPNAIQSISEIFIALIQNLLNQGKLNNLKYSDKKIKFIEIPINIPYTIKINITD